jgi:5-methylcytosine-specific restriction endonuclease McrA
MGAFHVLYYMLRTLILQIKAENPIWGYAKIAQAAKCSKNGVRFHLSAAAREKVKQRVASYRKRHRLEERLRNFTERKKNFDKSTKGRRRKLPSEFTVKQLRAKLEKDPFCYLTGDPIDLTGSNYTFDHKIPVARGGKNTLVNLGLATKEANQAKADLTLTEFIELCLKVVKHAGYAVNGQVVGTRTRTDRFTTCDATITTRT